MQFSTIYGEVQNNFSPDWLSRIKVWVNTSYHDVISRKYWSWTERVALLSSVAGQTNYSLVGNASLPDFRALIDFTVLSPTGGKPELIEAQRFDELTSSSAPITGSTGTQTLPVATLNVTSTAGFPTAGYLQVAGAQIVAYTGLTGTSFTGASGGSGSVPAGSLVRGVVTGLAPVLYSLAGDYPPEAASSGVVAGGVQALSVWPAFAQSISNAMRFRYYRGAGTVELTADADVPMIPARHHFLLVEMANAIGYATGGQFLQAQEWDRRAEQRIQQMVAEDGGMRRGDEDELTERQQPAAA